MPATRLIVFVHDGVVSDEELLSSYKAVYDDPDIDVSFNQLVDLRRADSTPRSAAALRGLVDVLRPRLERLACRPRIGIVAPASLSYGLARMFEAFSQSVPMEIEVFRAVDAALEWLGVSSTSRAEVERIAGQTIPEESQRA
jgi:hypothetical protein